EGGDLLAQLLNPGVRALLGADPAPDVRALHGLPPVANLCCLLRRVWGVTPPGEMAGVPEQSGFTRSEAALLRHSGTLPASGDASYGGRRNAGDPTPHLGRRGLRPRYHRLIGGGDAATPRASPPGRAPRRHQAEREPCRW